MSAEELEQIISAHSEDPRHWAGGPRCWTCVDDWPCLPYRLAEALVRTKADVADAWDAGERAGRSVAMRRMSDETQVSLALNPHRSEATA